MHLSRTFFPDLTCELTVSAVVLCFALLQVSYSHLAQHMPVLAIWVADEPEMMLALFDKGPLCGVERSLTTETQAAHHSNQKIPLLFPSHLRTEAMAVAETLYNNYRNVHSAVHVRITNLPVVDCIRDLRQVRLCAALRSAARSPSGAGRKQRTGSRVVIALVPLVAVPRLMFSFCQSLRGLCCPCLSVFLCAGTRAPSGSSPMLWCVLHCGAPWRRVCCVFVRRT